MSAPPSWVREEFDALNARFFAGALEPIHTVIMPPPFGTFAATTPRSIRREDGTRQPVNPMIFIHPRVLAQGRAFVSDTLLHEMIHMALEAETGDGDKDHGRRFATRANALGAMLGLTEVDPGSDNAMEWPQSVRPEGFHRWT